MKNFIQQEGQLTKQQCIKLIKDTMAVLSKAPHT